MSRSFPFPVTAVRTLLLLALLVATPASAQYVFLDVNGDGACDTTDVLTPATTSVDVWFVTNAGRDGSPIACADTHYPMTFYSYEFILRALGSGTVTYGAYANLMPTMTTQVGPLGAGGSADYFTGFGGYTYLAPGAYRVGTLGVTVTGSPKLTFTTFTLMDETAITAFGSQCPGLDFDQTIQLGVDFTDACGTAGGSDGGSEQYDPTMSYFVPQAGSVASPVEGYLAYRFFRQCPNNDGGASLPNNARVKVVVNNAGGSPIAGVAAAEICLLFNGGTAAQGFTGEGADSIIANSTWNQAPLCPDVRCIPADAPTDASGTTYITFTGASPSNPGVAVRDPGRKWGHYDSEIPVYVLGSKIPGRLDSFSPSGTYVLRIKNFDWSGGLAARLNEGASVTLTDFNGVVNGIGVNNSLSYWKDFDSSGGVSLTDFNLISRHTDHDCTHPMDP